MNVPESRFPALIDAAKQQTELVIWVAKTLQEHESRIENLTRLVATLPSRAANPASRASRSSAPGAAPRAPAAPSAASPASPPPPRPSSHATPPGRRAPEEEQLHGLLPEPPVEDEEQHQPPAVPGASARRSSAQREPSAQSSPVQPSGRSSAQREPSPQGSPVQPSPGQAEPRQVVEEEEEAEEAPRGAESGPLDDHPGPGAAEARRRSSGGSDRGLPAAGGGDRGGGRSSNASAFEAVAPSARGSREVAPSELEPQPSAEEPLPLAEEPPLEEEPPPPEEDGQAAAEEYEEGLDDYLDAEAALAQDERAESRSPYAGLALAGQRMSTGPTGRAASAASRAASAAGSAAGGRAGSAMELESMPQRRSSSHRDRAVPTATWRRGSSSNSLAASTPGLPEQKPLTRPLLPRHEEHPEHPDPDYGPDEESEHEQPAGSPYGRPTHADLEVRIKASDDLLFGTVEEIRKRLEPLEDALAELGDDRARRELKEVRLQSADLRMDLDFLQSSVSEIRGAVQSLQSAREKDLQASAERDAGEAAAARPRAAGSEAEPPLLLPEVTQVEAPPPLVAGDLSDAQLLHPDGQLLGPEGLAERVARLEARAREWRSSGELENIVPKLEERLLTLDAECRGSSAVMQSRIEGLLQAEKLREEEGAKSSQHWNLAHQVDVIQSVVAQEMRQVRADLMAQLHELDRGSPEDPGSPRSPRVSHQYSSSRRKASIGEALGTEDGKRNFVAEVQDLSEKVKRLQDCYQQCTLKLAAMKTASRHTEQQTTMATEKMKKLGEDTEYLIERSYVYDTRLEYAAVLHSGMALEFVQPAPSAKAGGEPKPRGGSMRSPRAGAARDSHLGAHVGDGSSFAMPSPAGALGAGGALGGRSGQWRLAGPHTRLVAAPQEPSAEGAAAEQREPEGGLLSASSPTPRAEEGKTSGDPDTNTQRIMRLGKKVSEMGGQVFTQFKGLHDDLEVMSQKLGMIITFLPRRQRRIVERILASGSKGKDEDHMEDDAKDKSGPNDKKAEGGRRVMFSEKAPETRAYHVTEDEHQVPWQAVGEYEQKWHWCLQPMTELGRSLAIHFEQMEHEHTEFEQEVMQGLEKLQEQVGSGGSARRLRRSPTSPTGIPKSGEEGGGGGGGDEGESFLDLMTPDGLNSLCNRVQKAVLPQLGAFEDRIERIVGDLRDVRRLFEKDRNDKVDKEEFQLLAMRLAVFDRLDPKDLDERLADLETGSESLGKQFQQLQEDQRRNEANSVHRSDFAKVKTEYTVLKGEHQKLQQNVREMSNQIFGANRKLTQTIADAKSNFERAVSKLEKEKATMWEYNNLLERLNKLEASMRDNRQILSGAGAQDVNAFVKRIILNMEDKLMVLEKKIECLAEGRPLELQGETGAPADPPPAQARGPAAAAAAQQEGQVQALGQDLTSVSQAVAQLKQEVHLSKVSMDHILEQSQLHADLAQRLSVYVEKVGSEEGTGGEGEQGAVLSMNRVQVMISAAARQLVAGSKWVTKEIFDARFGEFRKEYLGTSRQLQTQLEELGGLVLKSGGAGGPGAGAAVKLPRMLAQAAEWPPDPSLEKQSRYKDRPPGTAPAQAGGGLNGPPGPKRAGGAQQQRPMTERGASRTRAG